jgi:hypothetical protein
MSSRSRMFGGTPPSTDAGQRPLPTGIQALLRLAAVDADFRRKLLESRGAAAAEAGVELTPSEQAVLQAAPAAQLELMIDSVPPPDRRSFLQGVAASAVTVLGGAALAEAARLEDLTAKGGARPDVPQPTRGIRPDVPPPKKKKKDKKKPSPPQPPQE